jgi:AraC-like DNA-binding protein
MSYNQVEPIPSLQDHVKCFWTLEEAEIVYNESELVPDSYLELVFNCGAPLIYETPDGLPIELPRTFLMGLQTKPLRLQATGLCQIIAMRLYAWSAVRPLLNTQPHIIGTPIIPLAGIWQDLAQTLETTLYRSGYSEAVECLQQVVSAVPHRAQLDWIPMHAVRELLYTSRGQVRISQLAARCCLSSSQFERRFKHLTGVSPKTLARLIRFEAIRDALISDPLRRPVDLANDFGYTDQAHFIHDFKAFAARTPGEFVADFQANIPQYAEFLQYD